MPIPVYTDPVPALTTAQMIEVDRAMIEEYHIDLIQMMENAGRNLAHLARERFLAGDPRGRNVVVLAGTGGNGGGALVCARRLHNYGAAVQVVITRPNAKFTAVPGHQLNIVRQMGISVTPAKEWVQAEETPADLVIDGIIGYSLQGSPRGAAAEMIHWANRQPAPVLALDAPSGLDTASGTVYESAVRAAATMTLALPKVGLLGETAVPYVGELYLADISVPPELYANPSFLLKVGPIFAASDIIRLR